MDDIEIHKTVSADNQVYENTRIAVSVLDNTNSGMNEYYEPLQRPPTDNKSKVPKYFCTAEAKQKLILLILVATCVSISSVSLVIALTIQEKAQAVDGSWSSWELWEACSVTCDVGMQRRHRNCSNPAPLGNGRQCLGVDNEHKLCMPGPCSTNALDGSWSSWELWEACSATCDVGMQRRHRNCSNHAPLGNGRQCLGEDNEHKLCMPGPCSNGGWSAWDSWGSCSASCNIGLKSRFRTCTNPRPSMFGSVCEGDNMQVEICESSPCKETHVAFNVHYSSVINSSKTHTVIFTGILLNEGRAYNQATGVFTAPFSGLYQFNGQICTQVGKAVQYTLQTEGYPIANGEYRTPLDSLDGKCTSFSAVASVLKDKKVWITSAYLFQSVNDWNSFSGILIHKK